MATNFSSNHSVVMDKLKDTVLRLADSDPNNPLSSSQIRFIQHQLLQAFPVFRTPTHPAYSAMIQDAIKELNEEDGSNEESISEFIKAKYKGLPWAHNMYLTHHLCKLCENGEIVCNSTSKCYAIPTWAGTQELDSRKKQLKRKLWRKRKEHVNECKEGNLGGKNVVEESGDLNGVQEEGIEENGRNEDGEVNISGEKVFKVSGNLIGFQEEDIVEFRRRRMKPRRRSLVVVEESDEVGRHAVDEGEQNLVVKRHNEVLAQEDRDGDTIDAAQLMPVPTDCVKEPCVTLITPSVSNVMDDKNPELAVKELGLTRSNVPTLFGIQEDDLRTKQPKQKLLWQRKKLVNDKVLRAAVDGAEQNFVAKRHNEVMTQENGDDDTSDTVKLMLVPAECVEESPVTVVFPSMSNIGGDNDSEHAGKASYPKESELMIVPYEGNTSINSTSDMKDRMVVCGLASNSEQKQSVCRNSTKKRLKVCKQEKKKVSLELIPSSSELAVVPNFLVLDQKPFAYKNSPKKRLNAGNGRSEISLETIPSFPALAMDQNLHEHNCLQELLSLRDFDTKASGMERQMGPAWLVPMLNGRYFIPCSDHVHSARNGCKLFCLDCMGDAFCFKCLPLHEDHRVVQIRKSSSYNMVKVDDIKRHLDISSIQTYTTNGAKIVFINPRPHLKPGKGSPCCQNCCCRLIDAVRFCSLRCKLCVALREFAKFKELPIDQSQQPCASSLLEDASVEQIETQNNLDPSYLSSLEDPILVEGEEDLPLQKVLEKCGKRKKQTEQKLTADAPLVTEASYLSGPKSQVDLPISEGYEQQIEDQERQSQNDVGLDVEAPTATSVEGNLPTSDKICEEPKQSEAINDSVNFQSKKLNKCVQGIFRGKMEVTKDGGTKQLKKGGRGRPRKKMEATKEDVARFSNLPVDQLEGLCDPANNQHSHQQMNPGKKKGRGRPRKYLKAAKNDAAVSSNSELQQQTESAVPTTDDVVHGRKHKKEGRGRPRKKKQDISKEDSAVQLELAHKLEEKEYEVDDCLEKSQSEAEGKQDGGQAMPPSDDIYERMKNQYLDGGDEKQETREHEAKQGTFAVEGLVRLPKEKSGKSTSIQVPLSSIDRLRSRMKNQPQDSA